MIFANVRNNEILDFNSFYLDEDIIRVETTQEMQNAYDEDKDKIIYQDGTIILNPNYEEEKARKERERLNKLSLTKREVFLALYNDKGITPEAIKEYIKDPESLIEFEYANDYFRGNPLIDAIGQTLGYSSEQLDYLFEHKEFPEKEEPTEEINETTTDYNI